MTGLRRLMRWPLIAAPIIAILIGAVYLSYRREFPNGYKHCCDLILKFALDDYAKKHEGWYPKGESCPEASLSLLYRENREWIGDDGYLLAGKACSPEVATERLGRGDLLTPETCDWFYVEGLRSDDDRRLALFWDKIGSGHDGQRMSTGGHSVMFVGFERAWIPVEDWADFVAEQKKLAAGLPNNRGRAIRFE